ncbi:response regulator, partial [Vibrio metschnikovii]|nr:response regulator [Vibrio metschnikovii]
KNYNNNFQVVAEVTDVKTLFEKLQDHEIDILITDYCMPHSEHIDGMSMIKKLQREYPSLKIIVFTQMANPALLNTLVIAGVNGVLLKKDILSDIHRVLDVIKNNGRYLSKGVNCLITNQENNTLSIKELEVLRMLASGMSVSKIAEHTNRSIKTISTQKKRAMAKLGLENNSDIYEYMKENNMT